MQCRLLPVGQAEGAAILTRLAARCPALAAEAQNEGLDGIGTAAPLIDIASMRHEAMGQGGHGARMFRS